MDLSGTYLCLVVNEERQIMYWPCLNGVMSHTYDVCHLFELSDDVLLVLHGFWPGALVHHRLLVKIITITIWRIKPN